MPSFLAAFAITGAIRELPCMPPGARCAPRDGVLVSTVSVRHRMASGWYDSEM